MRQLARVDGAAHQAAMKGPAFNAAAGAVAGTDRDACLFRCAKQSVQEFWIVAPVGIHGDRDFVALVDCLLQAEERGCAQTELAGAVDALQAGLTMGLFVAQHRRCHRAGVVGVDEDVRRSGSARRISSARAGRFSISL